jgi:hypothetical protein
LVSVLLIIIPVVWLAVLAFAVTMCRLAALSDRSRSIALAERLAVTDISDRRNAPAGNSVARRALERHSGDRRANFGGYGS